MVESNLEAVNIDVPSKVIVSMPTAPEKQPEVKTANPGPVDLSNLVP